MTLLFLFFPFIDSHLQHLIRALDKVTVVIYFIFWRTLSPVFHSAFEHLDSFFAAAAGSKRVHRHRLGWRMERRTSQSSIYVFI